jgi:Hydrazine synthase alpha subunit middle domain
MSDNTRMRDQDHALPKLTALLLPLLAMIGCSSGISGHAPGLAGPQSLDPGTFTYPLAYIKRPPVTKDIDARELITSTAGGDLYIRDQASAGGVEVNLTNSITMGQGDVRDLDVSPDGKKLVFSLRLPLIKGAKEINQPTWKIYQYDAVLKTVTQLTNDSTRRGHDVGAHYLPDGRIVFASTRQAGTQGILIDEGRPEYPAQTDDRKEDIFLLHVMDADGNNIKQISFNTNHDFAPSVLSNGQIVFSRYESINGDQISLYRVNPDGSGLELFYGANSHATGANNAGTNNSVIQFLSARQRADGKLLALVRPLQYTQAGLDTQEGGDIVAIDAGNFVEIHQQSIPTATGTPATAGTGHVTATPLGVTTDPDKPSLGGRFASAFPLFDGTNRMLVSWAPCLVLTTPSTTSVCTTGNTTGATVTLAPPQYTIWVYDFGAGTLSPILAAESGLVIVEPVLLQARVPAPTAALPAPSTAASTALAGAGLGVLDIRSVYDFDGVDTVAKQTANAVTSIAALADPKQATADQRPARFIRVEKAVEIPSKDVRKINNSAFGPAGMGMREILAYAPIEPDGSVKIQLPANVPFTIEILDKNARRIGAPHTSWLQLVPGETKTCTGCHDPANPANPTFPLSHGRSGLTKSVYAGASAGGANFANTVASLPAANAGDTMAETRAWNTCQTGSPVACAEIPSIDVLYTDVWTDAAVAGRPVDAPFSYLYADLSTPSPANKAHCGPWSALCRSTIHYPDDTMPPYHIQSIWDFARLVTVGGLSVDHTCVSCHTPIGAAAAIQIPAGELDLRAAASTDDTSVSTSYRQLLFPRDQQTLIMGVPTPTGVVLPPPMAAGSSINSYANFFRLFDGSYRPAAPAVDHTGFLTAAELRLISEWIDIGAQYYNDPFVAPVAN